MEIAERKAGHIAVRLDSISRISAHVAKCWSLIMLALLKCKPILKQIGIAADTLRRFGPGQRLLFGLDKAG